MGVANMNAFLKKHCPHAFSVRYIHELRGLKLAIDSPIAIKKIASTVHKNLIYELPSPSDEYDHNVFVFQLKHNFIQFLLSILKNGIIPIFVFDGPLRAEKSECVAKRREDRIKKKEKISNAYLEYTSKLPLEITRDDDIKLLKMREQDFFSGKQLTEEEEKNSITDYKNIIVIKELLEYLHIPTLTADHDAEKLCASLSIEGLVSAVLSTDTDNYVLGTRLTISKIQPNGQMNVVNLYDILDWFQMEFQRENRYQAYLIFLDFCIMCGCDFNKNIHGISCEKSLKLLKKHLNIDSIGTEIDVTCLNHVKCREIFSLKPSMISNDKLLINIEMFKLNMNNILLYFQSKILNSSYHLVNMDNFLVKTDV